MLASRIKRMEVLDELRSKLPPDAIKQRYGKVINVVVRDFHALCGNIFRFDVRMHRSPH